MRRRSRDLNDLNDRVEAIERFIWGDDIDGDNWEIPEPPGPGGLMGVLDEIQTFEGKPDPKLRTLKHVASELSKMKLTRPA
jgi:hypothetical protein